MIIVLYFPLSFFTSLVGTSHYQGLRFPVMNVIFRVLTFSFIFFFWTVLRWEILQLWRKMLERQVIGTYPRLFFLFLRVHLWTTNVYYVFFIVQCFSHYEAWCTLGEGSSFNFQTHQACCIKILGASFSCLWHWCE